MMPIQDCTSWAMIDFCHVSPLTGQRHIAFDRGSPSIDTANNPTGMQGIKDTGWLAVLMGVWLIFLLGMALWHAVGLDFWIADALYRFEGQAWAWRGSFLAQDLVHQFGGAVVRLLGLILIVRLLRARLHGARYEQIRPLCYLTLSVVLSAVVVTVLKKTISIDCPWSLLRYGGTHPFVGLLGSSPASSVAAGCFPAGHASGGYAWIALFYYYRSIRPNWKWWGLAAALATGLVFGISQQFRGAHFASHDLWTIMICWSFAYSLDAIMLKQVERPGAASGRWRRSSARTP